MSAARLQRPRHAHAVHRRRQQRRPPTAAAAVSATSAAWRRGAHRCLQGALVDAGRGDRGGYTATLVAAIDQAVADGVDVINYSISGTTTNFLDPVEIAFLFAADAGVFVATSAGNSGPTTSTVAHPSPWLTTVARHAQPRGDGSVTLGNGATYTGASLANASAPRRSIDSGRRPAGANADRVSPCASPTRSIRRRWPARSCSATAASTPASTRAWRSRTPAASA